MALQAPRFFLRLRARFRRHGALDVVARGTGSALVLQGAALGLGYLLQVLLARWLGAAAYGGYTYVMVWASLLALPAGLGLPLAVVRFVPEYRVQGRWPLLRGLLWWSGRQILLVGAGLALTVMLTAGVLEAAAPSSYASLFAVGCWMIPLHALMNLASGVYRGFHRIGWAYAMAGLRHALVLLIAFLVWWWHGALTAAAALAATLGAYGLVLCMQGPVLWRTLPQQRKRGRTAHQAGTWLRVSLPLMLVGGFALLLGETDTLMIGMMLGAHETGLYRAAARTAGLASLVPVAVGAAADPMLVALHATGDTARLQHFCSAVVQWAFWASLAVGLVLAIAGRHLLALFGAGFAASYGVLVILASGQVFYAGVGLAAGMLNLTGNQRLGMVIFGGSALLNVVFNYLGIVLLGSTGAAVATSAAVAVMSVALWWLAKRRVRVDASIVFALRPKRNP